MTPPEHADDRMDRKRFTLELQSLVARAQEAGVEPGGAYNVRSPDPVVPDYTIEITEQEKRVTDGGVDSVPPDSNPQRGDIVANRDTATSGGTGAGTPGARIQRRAIDRFLLEPTI